MKRILGTVIVAILLLAVMAGCKSEEKSILGAWDDGLGEVTEFTEEGKVFINGRYELEYKVTDEGQIEILDPWFNNTQKISYELKDDKLLMLDMELTKTDPVEHIAEEH